MCLAQGTPSGSIPCGMCDTARLVPGQTRPGNPLGVHSLRNVPLAASPARPRPGNPLGVHSLRHVPLAASPARPFSIIGPQAVEAYNPTKVAGDRVVAATAGEDAAMSHTIRQPRIAVCLHRRRGSQAEACARSYGL